MEKLHTLTVQDFIWLNQELTKKRQKFSYATLEEGVFYQYAYGASTNVVEQAARLLTGFAKLRPFEQGSHATALAGMIAFLKLNGLELKLDPSTAAAWVEARFADPKAAAAIIEGMVEKGHGHHGEPSHRLVMGEAVASYGEALNSLVENEPERPLAVR